ncbi:MAG: hypothetical protein V9G29_03680 [Burkholderiaceae bacterium]
MNRTATERQHTNLPADMKHQRLKAWVDEIATLTDASGVYWCDGTQAEYDRLCNQLVAAGTMKKLNPELRPQQLPGHQRPERCGPRRGPHLSSAASARKTPARPTTGWQPSEMRTLLQIRRQGTVPRAR